MKKSEFKEYLKNEVLKMTEATDEDIAKQKELNAELEKLKNSWEIWKKVKDLQ